MEIYEEEGFVYPLFIDFTHTKKREGKPLPLSFCVPVSSFLQNSLRYDSRQRKIGKNGAKWHFLRHTRRTRVRRVAKK